MEPGIHTCEAQLDADLAGGEASRMSLFFPPPAKQLGGIYFYF
jgi:hypothetical protein